MKNFIGVAVALVLASLPVGRLSTLAHADATKTEFRLYLGNTTLFPSYFKDVWSRRSELFGNLGKPDHGPLVDLNLGTGLTFAVTERFYAGLLAQGGVFQDSDEKKTTSTVSSILSALTFLPISEYKISTTSTQSNVLALTTLGYVLLLGTEAQLRLALRMGAGYSWYKEDWTVTSLSSSSPTTEYSFSAKHWMLDGSTGLEFAYGKFFAASYWGYRLFRGGNMDASVSKGRGPGPIGNVRANFQSAYIAVAMGLVI